MICEVSGLAHVPIHATSVLPRSYSALRPDSGAIGPEAYSLEAASWHISQRLVRGEAS